MKVLEVCVLCQGFVKMLFKDVVEEVGLLWLFVWYFVGNCDEMISKLFDGMISCGEEQLECVQGSDVVLLLEKCFDFLFEGVFVNEIFNVLIGEFWYLVDCDVVIWVCLVVFYQWVYDFIMDVFGVEGLGVSDEECCDVVFVLVLFFYGDVMFCEIGL